jgi:hypothetical protein
LRQALGLLVPSLDVCFSSYAAFFKPEKLKSKKNLKQTVKKMEFCNTENEAYEEIN